MEIPPFHSSSEQQFGLDVDLQRKPSRNSSQEWKMCNEVLYM